MPKSADSFLPLGPTVFNILLALADGEKHGYAIMREIRARTGDALGTSTLYGIIKRLVEDELIEECAERPDPALDDERRRYYQLTPLGRRVAKAEARRLEQLLADARATGLLPRRG